MFHRCLIDPPAIAGVAVDCVNVWMFPGGHIVHYPVGKNGKLNLVAITPKASTPWQHFKTGCVPMLDLLANMPTDLAPWPGLYAPPIKSWVSNGVLLMGDAAHATLPYLAQGAAMSLEDAATLASVLPPLIACIMRSRKLRHGACNVPRDCNRKASRQGAFIICQG